MADSTPEPSSSLSITSSSVISNGSSAPAGTSLEIVSLSRLSCNLERLLIDQELDCSDADIVPADGAPVGVHRCILAARSPFFRELFSRNPRPEGRPRYVMSELVPQGKVGREAFMAFLSYLYTGKLRPAPVEVSTCVDHMCAHDACRPAINFVVELMYASSVFQIPELVSLFQVFFQISLAATYDFYFFVLVSAHSFDYHLSDVFSLVYNFYLLALVIEDCIILLIKLFLGMFCLYFSLEL